MTDKKHWYDGHFYDKFIAPNQDKIYAKIKKIIPENSSVLDFGCGTGRLSFQLSKHCSSVTAVDLSSKNIRVAESRLKKSSNRNILFIHGDFPAVRNYNDMKYDYAVISYVIHEMPEESRVETLKNLSSVSAKIIISDYISPIPKNLNGALTYAVEYLAGKDHFTNFRKYTKKGGIKFLAAESGLKITREIKNKKNTFHLAVME